MGEVIKSISVEEYRDVPQVAKHNIRCEGLKALINTKSLFAVCDLGGGADCELNLCSIDECDVTDIFYTLKSDLYNKEGSRKDTESIELDLFNRIVSSGAFSFINEENKKELLQELKIVVVLFIGWCYNIFTDKFDCGGQ